MFQKTEVPASNKNTRLYTEHQHIKYNGTDEGHYTSCVILGNLHFFHA